MMGKNLGISLRPCLQAFLPYKLFIIAAVIRISNLQAGGLFFRRR